MLLETVFYSAWVCFILSFVLGITDKYNQRVWLEGGILLIGVALMVWVIVLVKKGY